MDAFEALTRYYGQYDEDARLAATKHGRVEYLTTMRYIEKYMPPGMKVLEIGAGTGRYSHALARDGFCVCAVELVERNVDILKANTQPGESIEIFQGDARDLSFLPSEAFDAVLMLGPMYHLFTQEDQLKALSEAMRVAKAGGLLYTAYCISDASLLKYGFARGNIFALMENGLLDGETFKTYSTPKEVFQLYRKEDIDKLMTGFPARRLHYVATDLFTNHMRDAVDAMDDETFKVYMRYHLSICERPDMVGATHHSLDIVRKI